MSETPENPQQKAAAKLQAARRRAKALELCERGWNFADIGRKLGISRQRARMYIEGELEKLAAESKQRTDARRELELLKLARRERHLWTIFRQGARLVVDEETRKPIGMVNPKLCLGAIVEMNKISTRRSKLLGLDAPIRKELTGKDGRPLAHLSTTDIIAQLRAAGMVVTLMPPFIEAPPVLSDQTPQGDPHADAATEASFETHP